MNLINLATASDGDVRLALSVLHRIQGMCFELGFRGDDERSRAHELGLRREARGPAAFPPAATSCPALISRCRAATMARSVVTGCSLLRSATVPWLSWMEASCMARPLTPL